MKLLSSIPQDFDWHELSKLFDSVGWGMRCAQKLEKAFLSSGNLCLVFISGKLVGCGRSVDDGEYYSLLVDVIVSPDHQNKSIGKAIMDTLTKSLADIPWVILSSEIGKEEFYLKQGFKKMKLGYMLPKTEQQQEKYCHA